MIYCIGISHAAIFSATKPCSDKTKPAHRGMCEINPDHPQMRAFFLGPMLAYNLIENRNFDKILDCLRQCNRVKDTIIMYVGDIDVRYQIPKQSMEKAGKVENLVPDTVARYMQVIAWMKADGWQNLVVLGVHPTTLAGHNPNINTPHWGDCKFRNSICVLWNEKLRIACEKMGVTFVSFYDQLVDENNLTRMEYFVDYCHLSYDKCFPIILQSLRDANVKGMVEPTG